MVTWSEQDERNYRARCAAKGSKPQPVVQHESVAEVEREATNSIRHVVRIRSFRVRLCDPDNLCPKYFIDCLRYAGSIPDDRPEDIELSMRQIKVSKRSEDRTEIEIVAI